MNIQFEVKGAKVLQQKIKRTTFLATRAARQATLEEAREIMAESLQEVPKGSGVLERSAFVKQDAQGMVNIGYGAGEEINPHNKKPAREYMVAVHERLDAYHEQGKAKFLEDPVNRHAAGMKESIAAKLRRLMNL